MNHVPCMIRANLPVYVKWSYVTSGFNVEVGEQIIHQYPFLSPYQPNLSEIVLVGALD